MDDDDLLLAVAYLSCRFIRNRRRKKRKRQYWVRPINQRRPFQGDYFHLFQELKTDNNMFFRYTRMTVETFDILLRMIGPDLRKKSWRALPPEQILSITLRYLATGDQVLSLAFAHRIGESTAYKVIKEVCDKIIEILSPIYLKVPTKEEYINIAKGFWQRWNFPNCLGAFDGKHILIQAPPNAGSQYFNYKKTHSIVLMAACDHNYKFTLVDVGSYGSLNDAGIFSASTFGNALQNGSLEIPRQKVTLPESNVTAPYFFIGDEGFQLTTTFLRPYSGKMLDAVKQIFNYRLSRARRIIENAFGILVSRWRIFRRPISHHPKYVDKIVLAAVCLHNFLKEFNDNEGNNEPLYCPPNFVDSENSNGDVIPGLWRDDAENCLSDLRPTSAHRATQDAYEMRDALADYFLTPEGAVSWQWDYIARGRHGGVD